MIPDETEPSLEELLQQWDRAKKRRVASSKRVTRRAAFSVIPLIVAFLSTPFLSQLGVSSSSIALLFLGLVALPICMVIAGTLRSVVQGEDWKLFQEIAKFENDKRVLPTALSGFLNDGVTLPASTLTKLLLSVEESDAEFLKASQREIWLFARHDYLTGENTTFEEMRALKFAAVHALGKIGDEQIVRDVERYLALLRQTKEDAPLLEAMEEILPAIQARATESLTAQSLLRASDVTQNDSTLLRAASASNATQKDELLRATVSDSIHE